MRRSPLGLVLMWVSLLIALGSCSADSQAPEGMGGAGRAAASIGEAPEGQAAMSATLRMAWLRAKQKAPGYDFVRDAGGTLRSKAGGHGATAEVGATARGVRLSSSDHGGFELGVETTSVGRDDRPASRGVVHQRADGQELVLDREDGVEERYLAGPLGLEQSYLVREKREGRGPLIIAVAFAGLAPESVAGASDRVRLVDDEGRVRGGYRDLVATDAEGREIAAHMEVRGASVALVIDDAAASYPLRVDPLVWLQQQKLTASDGAQTDYFGASIAVSGDTAVVTAFGDDDEGMDSGSAYVFVRSGSAWIQQQKLSASDGAAQDYFGRSVAISGDTAIVGAWQDDNPGHDSGSAYVFVRSGGVWTQQQKLSASDGAADDLFGVSVAVSGDTAIVGAFGDDDQGSTSGSAYVFVRSGGVWTQQQKLTATNGAANDAFGIAVGVSGDTALIGAYGDDSRGSVYVFARSGSTWAQQQKLTASDGATNDSFGYALAVSGDTAVIGAIGDDDLGGSSGSAYVFVRSGGIWSQQQKLTASDGAPGDNFGRALAISGDTAVIGAYQDDDLGDLSGSAYVFARSGSVWTQQQKLTASDGTPNDQFGFAVGVSGDTAIITALQADSKGAAYVFALKEANGIACTAASQCASGFCVDGVCCDTACNAGACDACSVAAGSAADGTCTLFTGNACNDGNACTQTDTCQAGVCTGGSPVTCTASDQCHVAGTCDPATGQCSNPNKADGSACNDGNACTQSDSCQAGACIGGNPVTCAASDQCHVAGACNPATGQCSNPSAPNGTACNDGNACSKNDVCTNGACGGTAYACTPTSCQASSTCDGNGGCTVVNKASGAACPDDGNACSTDACDGAGACQHPNKADGTSCGAGQVCASGSCASGCFIGGTFYAAGAVSPANACLVCAPQSSTTAWSNRADGTSCDDGNACTKSDVCTAGTCGGTAYTCTPTNCQASSTCDGNGGCTIVNKASGAACPDDGNACSDDTCDGAGTCQHPNKADGTSCGGGQLCEGGSCGPKCQIGGQIYAAGTINPANACEQCAPATSTSAWSNRANGTSCDDGNACTKNDVCNAGICGGTAYTCAPGACDASSTCDGNGGCTVTPKGSGVACPDDGDPCTADACNGTGTCAHPSLADGTSCAAGQVCNGGACAAGCFINGVLVAAGAPNPANACEVCNPAVATTAWSNQADGTSCDDGDACTQTDTCQAGVCTGGNPVVCAASDPCHDVGTCDSATGQCSNPAKADGASCDDGDACTQTDSCVSGVCVGGNAKSCPAIDECHVAGTCDKATGDCSTPAKADGEACSMGTCQGGVCTAAPDGGMGGSGGAGGSTSTGGSGGSGGSTSTGGSGGAGGSTSTGGSGGSGGSTSTGATSTGSTSSGITPDQAGGCSCRAAGADDGSERGPMGLLVGLMLAAGVSRRRGRGARPAGVSQRNIACLLACIAALSLGCASGSEPIAEAAAPLVGGTHDTGDPAVVMVFVQNATQAATCSGTVVSPHVVLTAAHCVDPQVVGGAVTPPYDFYVFLGDDVGSPAQLNDPSNFPRVETTAFDPLFATTPGEPTGATHDIGVVILKDAVSVPPMPMNRTPLGPEWAGATVRVLGYGQSKAGDWSTSDVKRQGTTTILSIEDEHLSLDGAEVHFCGGDSGGPTLIVRDGVESVAGVHSWVEHATSCTGNQYDIRVDGAAAFVDPFVAMYDPGFVLPGDGSKGEGGSGGGGGGAGGSGEPGPKPKPDEPSGCAMAPSAAPSVPGVAVSLLGLAAWMRARRRRSRRS